MTFIRPRIMSVPAYDRSLGVEAVELAAIAGLILDEWQKLTLVESLGRRKDGKWAAFEVALVLARQNGKDAILEARELAGLFLFGERLIIHSAHQFDTSLEHFNRLLYLIENTPDLDRRVAKVSKSHGEEGIQLKGGQRVRFRTRTKGGGRGFSGDCLMLNEAMILPESAIGALLPTLSARPNPQVWYAGSPVDQMVHEHGIALARVRERGVAGDDPRLAYFEWSLPIDTPEQVDRDVAVDEASWAQANPGFGIRISAEHVANEQRSMDARTFAVERLGVGDWPATVGVASVISFDDWKALIDRESVMNDPICLAFDVTPDRSRASIVAAGSRDDGNFHVEVIDNKPGLGWLPPRVAELARKHSPMAVVCDGYGPAASLVHDIEKQGVQVETTTAQEYAQACGRLVDMVDQRTVRHLGSEELASAIRGAATRPLGDQWAWARKTSGSDISPLVAGTLALSAAYTAGSGYIVDVAALMAEAAA